MSIRDGPTVFWTWPRIYEGFRQGQWPCCVRLVSEGADFEPSASFPPAQPQPVPIKTISVPTNFSASFSK